MLKRSSAGLSWLPGLLLLPAAATVWGQAPAPQLSSPNARGVAMGHLHYTVRDVDANRAFWVTLGGQPSKRGATDVVAFPDALVYLTQGESAGGTEGSVLNHVAFRVDSLETVAAKGLKVTELEAYPGVASVNTPEGERIELFDSQRATNIGFEAEPGKSTTLSERHNQPINVPIIAHHVHLYVPAGSETAARDWYVEHFGAVPGMRWRYNAADLPGINLNFSSAPEGGPSTLAPTKGRMLDHIGFEVRDLEAFCQRLQIAGIRFDVPYRKNADGTSSALLTDPWGTYIELTEGLRF